MYLCFSLNRKYIDPNKLDESFPRLSYTEAVKLLQDSSKKFTHKIKVRYVYFITSSVSHHLTLLLFPAVGGRSAF